MHIVESGHRQHLMVLEGEKSNKNLSSATHQLYDTGKLSHLMEPSGVRWQSEGEQEIRTGPPGRALSRSTISGSHHYCSGKAFFCQEFSQKNPFTMTEASSAEHQ